jgi:hypothetical protein
LYVAIGLAFLGASSGCATIVSGRHADVSFYSNVPNAAVVIRNKQGEQVMVAQTQSKVALKRKDRLIFPAQYTATFVAPGYQPVDVPIKSKVNPWVFGNVAFGYGGLVGLAVDNATGAAWSPKETSVYQELYPIGPSMGPMYSSTSPAPATNISAVTNPAGAINPAGAASTQPTTSLTSGQVPAAPPIYTASAINYTMTSTPFSTPASASTPVATPTGPPASPGIIK